MQRLLSASHDAVAPAQPTAAPTSPFAALAAPLARALEARGFTALTSVQRAILNSEALHRDLQISSQTGSGKTVALGFVLAAALQEAPEQGRPTGGRGGPLALIIVPTRELANQVCEELSWLFGDLPGVRVAAVTGGTPVHRDRQLLGRGPRVLVGTPGRLLDHVRSGVLELGGVRELVLDEADQMLDLGFREELEGILDTTPESRRTHLVSATFPEGIRQLTARYQRDPIAIEGTRLGDANKDIEHVGYVVHLNQRYPALVNLLLQIDGERTLVFVERRTDALEVASRLEVDGFAALPLSGELAQAQRERTLAAFRAGRVKVLVATDVAARGLDVPDVGTVIHTVPPADVEVYTHRSGRTGRAGKRGRSVLIAPPKRRRQVARLLAEAGVDLCWLSVPGRDELRAELATRAQQELEADLDAALAAGPSAERLTQAERILGSRDAAPVVAALLARLQPAHRARPKDVQSQREPAPASERPRRPQRERPNPRDRRGSVRFFINRGTNQGATPNRILATVCRRGQVTGASIGSIAIHPNASTFDVHADAATRFERLAGRRDARDPEFMIRRDRGPRTGAGQRRR